MRSAGSNNASEDDAFVQRTGRLRLDPGRLFELAHGALRDSLAEFEDAAEETPTAWHREVATTHDERAVAAHDDGEHPDDRTLRVAATFFAFRLGRQVRQGSPSRLHPFG